MSHYDQMQTLSNLLDTDPVSSHSRPATVKRYVRHIADTVRSTQHFDVTSTVAKTRRSERTYALTCTDRSNDRSWVIITLAHRHPANSGDESSPKNLFIHVTTHVDGRFTGHREFDLSETPQQLSSVTFLAEALQGVLQQAVSIER
ncbi:hypothetical protein GCM10009720_21360 [Yaniella flava]|uniref:Uncharacterized protein n=1 Tax=Yaniella flava TaxID=287930 RepID=A0ABN2UQ62_9MICC|nr:hypothetical protein [Micrococcaceae bacterium]